jgi:hypothetical protein
VETIIRAMIPAVERDDYGTISKKRDELREAIAPNAGMNDTDIRAAELSDQVKRVLCDLLAFIRPGPHEFRDRRYDGLELLNSALAAIVTQTTPNDAPDEQGKVKPPVGDGPAPPNVIRWQRQDYEFPPRLWQIANYLWNRDVVKAQEVVNAVWGVEGEQEIPDSTLRARLSELNSRFLELGIPRNYSLKHGYIRNG